MKLTILSVDIADLGLLYKCVAKNSIGDTDGAIKLYRKFISKILELFLYKIQVYIIATIYIDNVYKTLQCR